MTHSPRRGSTRRLLGYLRPYRLRFSLGLVTTALASLLDGVTLVILIPLLQQIFASAPPAGGGTKLETLVANVLSPLLTGVSPTAATVRLVLLLLVALVLKNALAYVSGQISVQIQESLVRDLRTQLFDHLLRLDLGFFERTRSGQISSRVMQDADASKGVVSAGLASFFQNLVVICTTLLVLTQISWRLTLIALAAAPVLLVTIRTLLKRKYYVDELYGAVIVAPALALANAAAAFDTHVIDGAVMGVGKLIGRGSQVLRRIQSGLVRRYVMTMLGGIVLVVAIFLIRVH